MTGVRWLSLGCAAMGLTAAAASAAFIWRPTAAAPPWAHFADAENKHLVLEGKHLYARVCSSCHGRRLQGQLLWQVRDQFLGQRAPAHDQSGHTWQHSDDELFQVTKFGRFSAVPTDIKSYMPAYAQHLSDDEILSVIAYIKASWPLGLRVSQALLNPDYAGMPRNAETVEWRLPPTCQAAVERAAPTPGVGFAVAGPAEMPGTRSVSNMSEPTK